MSTSTYVSRAEEMSRMRDLEDSFEDRYGKLKLIALKYKKKLAEQNKTIEELQKSLASAAKARSTFVTEEAQPANDSLREKLSAMTRNFNSVQAQYDLAQDKVEELEKQVKVANKDLEAMVSENVTLKEVSAEANQKLAEVKTELEALQLSIKEQEKEFESQKVMLEEETKERKSLALQVLNYKSMENDFKGKSTELEMVGTTVESLKLEVGELETARTKEQERADHAQQLLTNARNQLIQAETEMMKKSEELEEMKRKFEKTNFLLEDSKQELAQILSRTENNASQGRTRANQMERQIFALESSLKAKTEELKEKENEFDQIKKEFDSYKVRAQSVLKQAKEAKDEENNSKAQEEVKAMEKMVEMWKDKLKASIEENKTVKIEGNRLQEEHDRLMERHSLLLQEIASKEKSWRSKIETAEAKIKEQEKLLEDEANTVHKEIEDIKQRHDQAIQVLRTQHATETTKYKTQIDIAENEIVRLEFVLQKEQEARKHAEESAVNNGVNYAVGVGNGGHQAGMDRLDISQIEREAAEGQEVDQSLLASSLASPLLMPLDQLLAQPGNSGYDPDISRSTASSRQGAAADRQMAGSRQSVADRQLAHLSALLSESEAQNERLEKLTEVLKEEIRTYQRSEERHKHIENLEYIKNVILKFLTLTGEERARLVPVLSTILRLSKEEVASIQKVARSEEEAAAAGDSWGSYLHLWSTP